MGRWLVAVAFGFAIATAGHAQVGRQLPASGKLGELAAGQHAFPQIQIGGKVVRLTPGALIYDQNNRTILHNTLPERAHVLYVQEASGEVSRLYILRPEELELAKRRAKR